MRYGVSAYNVTATDLLEIGQAAEATGFDAIWLGEHLLLPYEYRSAHPTHEAAEDQRDRHYPRIVEESTELLDPLIALAGVASQTSRIRLATGIYLLPLRHPLVTARAAATLSDLSDGRFLLAVGAGWLQEEFDVLGVPFAGRGARHRECIEVLRAAFAGGPFEHNGPLYQLGKVQIWPRPVPVPIVMGGNSDTALRRAARLGDAWFSSGNPSFDEAVTLKARLEQFRIEAGRPEPLECFVRVGEFDPAVTGRYADAGLENLVFWAQDICPERTNWMEAFRRAASDLGIPPPVAPASSPDARP